MQLVDNCRNCREIHTNGPYIQPHKVQNLNFYLETHSLSNNILNHFLLRSNRIRVNLLSHERKSTNKQEQYDWRAEKNLDGIGFIQLQNLARNSVHPYLVLACPSKFFLALQSFWCCLAVVLLSYNSRSTLIRRNRTIFFVQVWMAQISFDLFSAIQSVLLSFFSRFAVVR